MPYKNLFLNTFTGSKFIKYSLSEDRGLLDVSVPYPLNSVRADTARSLFGPYLISMYLVESVPKELRVTKSQVDSRARLVRGSFKQELLARAGARWKKLAREVAKASLSTPELAVKHPHEAIRQVLDAT